MRVLLVEDDPTTSKSIEMMLSSAGMVLDITDLGEDGLEIGKLYDYDIIVLDLMLPDIDGYEVLRRLRSAKVETPVLILSGLTESEQKLSVNLDGRTVEVDDKPVHLTGKEYGIMELLSLRKGTTLTKEMFLNHLYNGMDEPELKIIDVFVCKLRKKLAAVSDEEVYIHTVWGRGYVLRDPDGDEKLASA